MFSTPLRAKANAIIDRFVPYMEHLYKNILYTAINKEENPITFFNTTVNISTYSAYYDFCYYSNYFVPNVSINVKLLKLYIDNQNLIEKSNFNSKQG